MHFQCKALAAKHFKGECKIRKECKFRECMVENRHGSHTITRLTVHIVWVTKYRYRTHLVSQETANLRNKSRRKQRWILVVA